MQHAETMVETRSTGNSDVWLRVIQINDVYELENFASLKTLVDEKVGQADRDLVVLAGDFLGPSLLSSLNHGASMVDCLNHCGFTHVCLGNHETDVSMDELDKRIGQSTFTWLNSNMPQLNGILQKNKTNKHEVLEVVNGNGVSKKVGLLGLLTADPAVYRPGSFADCEIQPVIETTEEKLLPSLKGRVDLILPLTHQSIEDDREFCEAFGCDVFPVIIGGHDHTIFQETVNGCRVSKTGYDAQHVAVIDIRWSSQQPRPTIAIELFDTADFEPDNEMALRVASHQELVAQLERAKLFPVSEWLVSESDTFSTVNNRLGPNLATTALTTLFRMGLRAELALMNAGSIRGNTEYSRDCSFTWKDLKSEIPYPTSLVTLYVPGRVLQDTITFSRRHAHTDPPVAHGGYIHTCDAVKFEPDGIHISLINEMEFDPDNSYLTVLPLPFLMGIDNLEPLMHWVESNGIHIDQESCVPAKNVIVEVYSTLIWLQLGSFNQLDKDKTGRIGRDAIERRVKEIYGPDVADFVVDNIMSIADTDGSDCVSPMEMAMVHFAARDMVHRRASRRHSSIIRDTVRNVLGEEVSEIQADGIARELEQVFDRSPSGNINRASIRQVLGTLRRKSLLLNGPGF